MNEFDLQMWERELSAWHRRLERQPPGALRSALHDLANRLHELRIKRIPDARESSLRNELSQKFATLRKLYESQSS
jgi:hypothetical protein